MPVHPVLRPVSRRDIAGAALLSASLGAALALWFRWRTGAALSITPLWDPAGVMQVTPWDMFAAQQWRLGRIPLWNPHTGLGVPHWANLQTAVLYPLKFIFYGWPTLNGLDAYLALRLAMFPFATYLLTRALGLSVLAGFIAAVGYGLSGYVLWFANLVDLNTQALTPLLVWATFHVRSAKAVTRRGLAAVSMLVALMILGGHPEAIFVSLMFVAGAVAWCGVRTPARLYVLGAAGAVGVILATIVVLPFIEYLTHAVSFHPPGFGFMHVSIGGLASLLYSGWAGLAAHGMPALVPELFTMTLADAFGASYGDTTMPGAFPTIGPVIAGLAVLGLLRARVLPPFALYCAAFALFFMGVTAGLPLVRAAVWLPVFNIASNFKFYFAEITLALTLLAAYAVDASGIRLWTRWKRVALAGGSVAAAIPMLYSWTPFIDYVHWSDAAIVGEHARADYVGRDGYRVAPLDFPYAPNQALPYAVNDIRASDALFPEPYWNWLRDANGFSDADMRRDFYERHFTRLTLDGALSDDAARMGVRYALSANPLDAPQLKLLRTEPYYLYERRDVPVTRKQLADLGFPGWMRDAQGAWTYAPASFRIGLWVSLTTLALWCALAFLKPSRIEANAK